MKNSTLRTILYLLIAIFLGFLIPYLVLYLLGFDIKRPEQQLINAIWRGSVYSLFALGYALVFSILGLLNLAHSSVFMWGAFLGLATITKADLPLWAALPAGMVGGGIVGVLVDFVAFLPLRRRHAPRTAQLISSIGVAVILVNLASITFGTSPTRFPQEKIEALRIEREAPVQVDLALFDVFIEPPLDPTTTIDITAGATSLKVTVIQISVLFTSLLLMFLLQYMVSNTRIGKAMRAVAFDPQVAYLLGINVGRIFSMTFILAGMLAGAAGVLYGLAFNTMTPFMGEALSLTGLTVIVIGGLGSIRGTVVGGFLIANAEILSIAAGYSWLADAVVFTALFLALLIRPQGLLGDQKLDKV